MTEAGRMRWWLVGLIGVALGGCSNVSASASAAVGAAGGTVEVAGVALNVPPGALSEDTKITVNKLSTAAPKGFTSQSALYELKPDGLTFAVPVKLTVEFTGSADNLALFLSAKGGGYEKISGVVEGQTLTAPILHFSSAFAGTGTGVESSIAAGDLERAYLSTWCHDLFLCGEVASEEGCTQYVSAMAEVGKSPADLSESRKGIDSGRIIYDGAAAKRCLDASLNGTTCAVESNLGVDNPDCQAVFRGTVAAGGACAADDECADGNFCKVGQTCPGVCAAPKLEGESLSDGDRCADDLYAEYTATARTCVRPVALGGTCVASDGRSFKQCAVGAFCDSTGSKTCVAKRSAGQACTSDSACSRGLDCVGATKDSMVCTARLGTGAACSDASAGCKLDLTCIGSAPDNANATCQQRFPVGGTCLNSGHCEPSLFCSRPQAGAGACAARKAENESCMATDECGRGLYCTRVQYACQEGQPCNPPPEALSGTCKPQLAPGASCNSSIQGQCSQGYCSYDANTKASTCRSYGCSQ